MPRWVLLTFGWVMVVIGVIGIALPLLPTTPFLLIAVYCFSASSPKFRDWLMNHPKLGPPIVAWRRHGVIRLPQKIAATLGIALSFLASLYAVQDKPLALIGMSVTLIGVLIFIWTRPSSIGQKK